MRLQSVYAEIAFKIGVYLIFRFKSDQNEHIVNVRNMTLQ